KKRAVQYRSVVHITKKRDGSAGLATSNTAAAKATGPVAGNKRPRTAHSKSPFKVLRIQAATRNPSIRSGKIWVTSHGQKPSKGLPARSQPSCQSGALSPGLNKANSSQPPQNWHSMGM